MNESGDQKEQAVVRITPAVWIMIAVLGLLFMVPFACMAMALQKMGYLPGRAAHDATSTTTTTMTAGSAVTTPATMDMSGLRSSAEKAAEKTLPIPQLAEPDVSIESLQQPNVDPKTQ